MKELEQWYAMSRKLGAKRCPKGSQEAPSCTREVAKIARTSSLASWTKRDAQKESKQKAPSCTQEVAKRARTTRRLRDVTQAGRQEMPKRKPRGPKLHSIGSQESPDNKQPEDMQRHASWVPRDAKRKPRDPKLHPRGGQDSSNKQPGG